MKFDESPTCFSLQRPNRLRQPRPVSGPFFILPRVRLAVGYRYRRIRYVGARAEARSPSPIDDIKALLDPGRQLCLGLDLRS